MGTFTTSSYLLLAILPAPVSYFPSTMSIFSEFKLPFLDIFLNEFDSFSTIQNVFSFYTTCNVTASKRVEKQAVGVNWLSAYTYTYKLSGIKLTNVSNISLTNNKCYPNTASKTMGKLQRTVKFQKQTLISFSKTSSERLLQSLFPLLCF